MNSEKSFSTQLNNWLKSDSPKTLGNLGDVFKEKSIAILTLFLMAFPALPIPTGGITHIFEIITMLLALELIVGRKSVWLPRRYSHMKLSTAVQEKAIPQLIKRMRWFERYSKPRSTWVFNKLPFMQIIGLSLFIFAVAAFLAPPFTGLDTLPALGAVLISLAIVLEDALMLIIGLIIGSLGIFIAIGVGSLLIRLFSSVF
jgi:hypothetical protein